MDGVHIHGIRVTGRGRGSRGMVGSQDIAGGLGEVYCLFPLSYELIGFVIPVSDHLGGGVHGVDLLH